jgi:hypothetical protein
MRVFFKYILRIVLEKYEKAWTYLKWTKFIGMTEIS